MKNFKLYALVVVLILIGFALLFHDNDSSQVADLLSEITTGQTGTEFNLEDASSDLFFD